MNNSEEIVRNDGANAKTLMALNQASQKVIAQKLGWHESSLSNLLKQNIIEDADLEKLAKAINKDLSGDCIKYFNQKDTNELVIQHLYQTIASGGKAYNAGSRDQSFDNEFNSTTNEMAFVKLFESKCDEIARLKQELIYYRMQLEPEKVKAEMEKPEE